MLSARTPIIVVPINEPILTNEYCVEKAVSKIFGSSKRRPVMALDWGLNKPVPMETTRIIILIIATLSAFHPIK